MPILDVARMDPSGEDLNGEEGISLLDPGDDPNIRAESPVRYALQARMVGSELIVTGSVAVTVRFRCSRCAEGYVAEMREPAFSFVQDLHGMNGPAGHAAPDARHAARHAPPSPEFVDLTPEVRESILLTFPSHPVCGPGCKGLCPRCGVNRNRETCKCRPPADGRWEMLDGLTI